MRPIIKKKRHYWTRLPLVLLLLFVIALGPLLAGILGSWYTEYTTGQPCHEGNCGWMVLPWLTVFTLPIGGIGCLLFLVQVRKDAANLNKPTK